MADERERIVFPLRWRPRSAEEEMGDVYTSVLFVNPLDPDKQFTTRALVDTGSLATVLPSAWKDRLGDFWRVVPVSVHLADQTLASGELADPVYVQMEGFRAVSTEVLFMDMTEIDGAYLPLIGCVVLEMSLAVVDMVSHRVVKGRDAFHVRAAS